MTHDDDAVDEAAEGAGLESPRQGGAASPIPTEPMLEHLDDALACIETVEARVPAPYRVAVLESLLALSRGDAGAGVAARAMPPAESALRREADPGAVPQEEMLIDLERYAHALAGPGRLLAKALITLEIVASQMGVDWMTPAEIERFLVDRARATHVYRTNVSNALRGARGLVDRRRRGRAYEYRITEAGRVVVDREVAILGPGPRD